MRSAAVQVRFRVRFENGYEPIFKELPCEPHSQSETAGTTIKIKISLLRGGGLGGRRGKSSKNACFRGKRHDNKILKVQILLSRNFVVIAQAPSDKERKQILSEYRLSTGSIVSKYGLDWSAVRSGLVPSTVFGILFDESASESHTQNSTRTAPYVRAACLQNETAPEKLLNRYGKRFEKREKIRKTIRNVFE